MKKGCPAAGCATGHPFLVIDFLGNIPLPSGKFIQRHIKIISDPDEQVDIRQSDPALIGGDRLPANVQLQGKGSLFHLFLYAQIPDIFTDCISFVLCISFVFFHLDLHGRYYFTVF